MSEIHHLVFTIPAFLIVATSLALWIRAFRRVAIPQNRSAYVLSWVVGGALGILALVLSESGDLSRIPAWFAVSTAAILLFTVSISRQKLGDNAIRVGDKIPAFTATDEYGELFDSRSINGHLLLIKFFRAHW
jgi:hypothetical protein